MDSLFSIAGRDWRRGTKIDQRVTQGFRDASRDDVTKYLDWLYVNISNSIQGIRRSVTWLVALMAAFELIVGTTATATITIFSVEISKRSIAIEFIPAAVAFLYAQVTQDSNSVDRSMIAFSKAFSIWSPTAATNKLDAHLWPTSPLHWSTFSAEVFANSDSGIPGFRVKRRFDWLFTALFYVFLAQSYYLLFSPHINRGLVAWAISLCFTLFCLWAISNLDDNDINLGDVTRIVFREEKDRALHSCSA